jgi:hypothetical protein
MFKYKGQTTKDEEIEGYYFLRELGEVHIITDGNGLNWFIKPETLRIVIGDSEFTQEEVEERFKPKSCDDDEIDFSVEKRIHVDKYINQCPTCEWFDGITCDSCDYGFPMATNNNGNRPNEVQDCNIYMPKEEL